MAPGDQAKLIEELWQRGMVEAAMKAVSDGLVATKDNGKPDANTRARCGELVLAYALGLPVKRQEIVTRNVSKAEDLERQLAQSPAARASMRRLLERLGRSPAPGVEKPASGQPDAEIEDSDLEP